MADSIVLGTISLNDMAGGLEKNIVLLANHFAREGKNVSLISFDFPGSEAFFDIDPVVSWHKVGNSKPHAPVSFRNRLQMILHIRRILKNLPSPVVICFHHGILFRFFLAKMLLGCKLVCSERNSLSLYKFIKRSKWSINFLLLTMVSRITVQFSGYVHEYPFWMRKKIKVIPNPVFSAHNMAKPDLPDENGRFSIVTVGRLCTQKNQNALIEAFAVLSNQFPDWDLHIIGDGVAHDRLQALINSLAMQNRITLEGKRDNVPAWLARSHLFCLPSQWEGFPNALAEAMAHGLPCVGFSDCAGVRDLIQHEKTGLLASQDNLAQCMEKLMSSAELRKKMGDASVEVMMKYSPDAVFSKWNGLLVDIV